MKKCLLLAFTAIAFTSCITNAILSTVVLDKTELNMRAQGDKAVINVKCGSSVKISASESWITLSVKSLTPSLTDGYDVWVTTAPSTTSSNTTGTIKFEVDENTYREIKVHRDGKDDKSVKDAEGHKYGVKQIGKYYWMTENLKCSIYDTESEVYGLKLNKIEIGSPLTAICYVDPSEYTGDFGAMTNYKIHLGYLYNWCGAMGLTVEEAKAVTDGEYQNKKRQGICPNGFHLPTINEVKDLASTVGGSSNGAAKLKTASGWKFNGAEGNDYYGFSAYPCGEYVDYKYKNPAIRFVMWTSTSYKPGDPEMIGISKDAVRLEGSDDELGGGPTYWKQILVDCPKPEGNAYNIRCVRN